MEQDNEQQVATPMTENTTDKPEAAAPESPAPENEHVITKAEWDAINESIKTRGLLPGETKEDRERWLRRKKRLMQKWQRPQPQGEQKPSQPQPEPEKPKLSVQRLARRARKVKREVERQRRIAASDVLMADMYRGEK